MKTIRRGSNFVICTLKLVFIRSTDPVDTGRKVNLYKKFRQRPGRSLCASNLLPVSTGIS